MLASGVKISQGLLTEDWLELAGLWGLSHELMVVGVRRASLRARIAWKTADISDIVETRPPPLIEIRFSYCTVEEMPSTIRKRDHNEGEQSPGCN
jgi:hypothetical protein